MTAAAASREIGYGALLFSSPASFFRQNGDRSAVAGLSSGSVEHYSDALVQLRPGTLWITNLDYPELRAAGLLHRPDLRSVTYLGTRVPGLLGERGLGDAAPDEQARWLAKTFGEVMQAARRCFGVSAIPEGRTLALALRDLYLSNVMPDYPDEVRYAFESATQEYTRSGSTRGVAEDDISLVVLRHHRQSYAARMLSEPVPSGIWAPLVPPPDPDMAARWVAEVSHGRPLLLRVEVRFSGERALQHAMLANLGSGAMSISAPRGREANVRHWIAAPEFLALSPHAEIHVLGALAAETFVPNPVLSAFDPVVLGPVTAEAMAVGPLRMGGRTQLTYSEGLLCESLWLSVARPPRATRDAAAMWLSALDRAFCLQAAYDILRLNLPEIEIAGFSRGRIWVRLNTGGMSDEDQHTLVARIAAEARLLPPVLPPARQDSERLVIAKGLKERGRGARLGASDMIAALYILGNHALIQDVH